MPIFSSGSLGNIFIQNLKKKYAQISVRHAFVIVSSRTASNVIPLQRETHAMHIHDELDQPKIMKFLSLSIPLFSSSLFCLYTHLMQRACIWRT
jgi:hypothetical protein